MLLGTEVTHATDLDLLTVLIGERKKATQLFAKASFCLFALLHTQAHRNGDLFCAVRSSARNRRSTLRPLVLGIIMSSNTRSGSGSAASASSRLRVR